MQVEVKTAPSKQAKTPAVNPTEQGIKEALKHGEIPQILREEWRLVPENSPGGIAIQAEIEKIARELFSAKSARPGADKSLSSLRYFLSHDFDAKPVRFMLADLAEPNAWFISDSVPPLIVITKGLFERTKRNNDRATVENWNDLALIIGHEMTHYKIRERYGSIENSKFEEGTANGVPVSLLYHANRDPRICLEALSRWPSVRHRPSWKELVDPHPVTTTLKRIYESSLAALESKHGDLTVNTAAPNESMSSLVSIVQKVSVTSHLDQILLINKSYSQFNPAEKIRFLREYIEDIQASELYPARLKDLNKTLAQIKELGPLAQNAIVELDRLGDYILDLVATDSDLDLLGLYRTCAELQTGKRRPIGRLKSLVAATDDFVSAVLGKNKETLRLAAEQIINLSAREPLLQTFRGQSFLQALNWPTFEFPDLDRVERGKSVYIEWRWLRDESVLSADIAEAAVLSGLGCDPLILGALTKYQDRYQKHLLFGTGQAKESSISRPRFISFSFGPADLKNNLQLSDLRVKYSGKVIDAHTRDFRSVGGKITDPTYRSNAGNLTQCTKICEQFAATLLVKTLPEAIKGNQKASALVLRLRDIAGLTDTEAILGSEFLETAPELFLTINEFALSFPKCANELIVLLARLKISNESGYQKAIRTLFNPATRSITAVSNIWSSVTCGIFLQFLFRLEDSTLSQKEKIEFIACNLELLHDQVTITPQLGQQFLALAQSAGYLPRISSINQLVDFAAKQENFTENIKKIRHLAFELELTWLIQEGDLPTLEQLIFIIENELLITDVNLTDNARSNKIAVNHVIEENLERHIQHAPLLKAASAWSKLAREDWDLLKLSESCLSLLVERLEKSQDPSKDLMHSTEVLLGSKKIASASLRKRVTTVWAQAMNAEFGPDNGSEKYRTRMLTYLAKNVKPTFTLYDRAAAYQALAEEVESQRSLSFALEAEQADLGKQSLKYACATGVLTESLIEAIRNKQAYRDAFLEFLLSDGSIEASGKFLDEISDLINPISGEDDDGYGKDIWLNFSGDCHSELLDPRTKHLQQSFISETQLLHDNFCNLPLFARAIVTKEMLTEPGEQIENSVFDRMLERVLPDTMKYATQGRELLKFHIECFSEFSRDLALAALLVARDKTDERESSVGEIVTIFAENMGPAYMKVIQGLEGNPTVPKDLREDLTRHGRRLKFDGARPPRWEMWRLIDALPEDALEGVKRVGAILGNASMSISVNLKLQGKGEEVLSLLRPYAEEKATFGFDAMIATAEKYPAASPFRSVTLSLSKGARERVRIEANCSLAPAQYDEFFRMYDGLLVDLGDSEVIEFTSARVTKAGERYYRMSKIYGAHFAELDESPGFGQRNKSKFALAIFTVELSKILQGRFDADRHGGQMKIDDRKLGHFDAKGMTLQTWTENDWQQLAEVLIDAVLAAKNSTISAQLLVDAQLKIEERGDVVGPLVAEVQKALFSLNEVASHLSAAQKARAAISAILAGVNKELLRAMARHQGKLLGLVPENFRELVRPAIAAALENGETPTLLGSFLLSQLNQQEPIKLFYKNQT